MKLKYGNLAPIFCVCAYLTGCSAVSTAFKKRNLEVKTQMSETVWLDPVSDEEKTVFVQVRNISDKQINIMPALTTELSKKGYRVVKSSNDAHYWIQANILKCDKMDLRSAQGFLNSGFGAAAGGAAVGALAMASSGNASRSNIIAGGLIGGAVGFVADSMVEDINYSMVTDLQIVEKTDDLVTTTEQSNIKSGSSSNRKTSSTKTDNKRRFQTRVVSNANQVNLEFEEAKPELVVGLSKSIAGIF